MSTAVALALGLLALAGAFLWLVRSPRRDRRARPVEDPDALAEAEAELEELDALADPDDADDKLHDWGPGAPNP